MSETRENPFFTDEHGASEHCPECGSAWVRTLSGHWAGQNVPVADWLRECKGCGHQYYVRDALRFVIAPTPTDPTP